MNSSTFQFVRRVRALFEKEAVNRKRAIAVAVLAAVLLFFFLIVSGPYGLINWVRLEKEKAVLGKEIRRLEAEGRDIRERTGRLQNDPAEIGKVARQKYGMAAPGEKVIKFVPAGDSASR